MISLDIQDGTFILRCPPRERDFAKQVPGMKFDSRADYYAGPANWTVAQIINGIFTPRGLEVTEAVQTWIASEYARVQQLINFKRSTEDYGISVVAKNGDALYPWQSNDAYFMALTGACLNTSVLGSGKTPVTLGAVQLIERNGTPVFPLLIVTRTMTLFQIEEEVHNWLPGHTTQVVTKGLTTSQRSKAFNSGADVVIIPWHLLAMHSKLASYGTERLSTSDREAKELNNHFRTVIFDEAHKALDPKTKVVKAMWAVADEVRFKYFLTNTPMENAPDELWTLLRAAFPQHFPASTRFKDRYCHMQPQFFGPDKCIGLNISTEAEFRNLYEPLHVERGEEVLADLPTREWSNIFVEMEGDQKRAYASMEKNGLFKDKKGLLLSATDPLVKRTRLLQLSNATPELGLKNIKNKETGETEEQVTVASYKMPSCKVDVLLEVLDKYQQPLLVFMDDRKLLDLCALQLDKAEISHIDFKGGMKDAIREAGRHEFQSGNVRVALCMFQCAAEGLTLTAASRVLYLQRDDSSIASEQSEGRIRRIGQTAEVVEYIDAITKDSEEHKVHENYLAKQSRRNSALGREVETREISA